MLSLKITNPLSQHRTHNILHPTFSDRNAAAQQLSQFLNSKYSVNLSTVNKRSINEAVEKFYCPLHTMFPVYQWCHNNDGNNGAYVLPSSVPCNNNHCCDRNDKTLFQSLDRSLDQSSFQKIAEFSIADLTTFGSKLAQAYHRISVKSGNDSMEIMVSKLGKECFGRYLCENSTVEFECQTSLITAANRNSIANPDNIASIGSCYIPLRDTFILQFKLVCFENDFRYRSIRVPIAGGCGVQLSNKSLDSQIHEMVSRRNHRRSDVKPWQQRLIDNYRRRNPTKSAIDPLSSNIITPLVLLCTSTENWKRTVAQSKLIIYQRSNAKDTIYINDYPCAHPRPPINNQSSVATAAVATTVTVPIISVIPNATFTTMRSITQFPSQLTSTQLYPNMTRIDSTHSYSNTQQSTINTSAQQQQTTHPKIEATLTYIPVSPRFTPTNTAVIQLNDRLCYQCGTQPNQHTISGNATQQTQNPNYAITRYVSTTTSTQPQQITTQTNFQTYPK